MSEHFEIIEPSLVGALYGYGCEYAQSYNEFDEEETHQFLSERMLVEMRSAHYNSHFINVFSYKNARDNLFSYLREVEEKQRQRCLHRAHNRSIFEKAEIELLDERLKREGKYYCEEVK